MDIQQVVKEVTVRGTFPGADDVARGYQKITDAADGTTAATSKASKAQESASNAIDKLRKQYQDGYREQQKYADAQKAYERAVNQGLVTQQRASVELANIATRLGQASAGQRAFAQAQQVASAQVAQFSGAAGSLGSILTAIGPGGIAAAAGVGAAVLALNAMSNASHELAQKARELREFAEVTGLSTAQVQALRSEASKFGVTSEEAQQAISHFTAQFQQLRVGQGELLTQVRRVNPALADQMAQATDTAAALTLFGKALQQTDNIFERNALVKAAAGRGGLRDAQFLSGLDVNGVTQAYVQAGKALDDNLIKKLAQLEIDITKTSSKARENIASIFAEDVLTAELNFVRNFLSFSEAAKGFTLSDGLKSWLAVAGKGLLSVIPGAGLVMAGVSAATADNRRGAAALPDIDPFGTFSAGGDYAKTAGKNPLFDLETLRKQVAAMGEAAPAAMKLKLALDELRLSEGGKTLSATQLAIAQDVLNKSFDAQRIAAANAAMGSATTVPEQLQQKYAALNLELAKGVINADQFFRGMGGVAADEAIRKQSDMVSALGDIATPIDQYRLKVMQLQQQLDQGRISQDTFTKAVLAANPVFKQSLDLTSNFANDFGQAMLQGKSKTDAFKSSIQNLESSLITLASKQLITSLFTSFAGAGLTGGGLGKLFGFAGGGIMTSSGPLSLPVHTYSGGGVANTPQVSIFAEGRGPEAYVPLPDGRSIPVNIRMPQQAQLGPSQVFAPVQHITVTGDGVTEDQVRRVVTASNAQLYRQVKKDMPKWSAAQRASVG